MMNHSLLGQGGERHSYLLLPTLGEAWRVYFIIEEADVARTWGLGTFLVKQERSLQRSDLF